MDCIAASVRRLITIIKICLDYEIMYSKYMYSFYIQCLRVRRYDNHSLTIPGLMAYVLMNVGSIGPNHDLLPLHHEAITGFISGMREIEYN